MYYDVKGIVAQENINMYMAMFNLLGKLTWHGLIALPPVAKMFWKMY